jgi:hypothetical protein
MREPGQGVGLLVGDGPRHMGEQGQLLLGGGRHNTWSRTVAGCIHGEKMPDYKKLQRIFLLTGVLCTRVAKGGSAPGLGCEHRQRRRVRHAAFLEQTERTEGRRTFSLRELQEENILGSIKRFG